MPTACSVGPPVKRQKASASIADIDDDELLELAQTQVTSTQTGKGFQLPHTARRNSSGSFNTSQQLSKHGTTPVLDEESELAELVRLANSRLASSSLAAAQQQSDVPSSSSFMEEEQPDVTAHATTSAAPSWSGAEFSGESMSVTVGDGRRAYCRLHNSFSKSPPKGRSTRPAQLLSVPIKSLLQKAEQESFDKALADSKKFSELTKAFCEGNLDDADMLPSTSSPSQQAGQRNLWVDKYSPKSFFELLSDEKVNIDVIKWVKSWDGIAHRKAMKQQNSGPEQKLLMLCGAPGKLLNRATPCLLHALAKCFGRNETSRIFANELTLPLR